MVVHVLFSMVVQYVRVYKNNRNVENVKVQLALHMQKELYMYCVEKLHYLHMNELHESLTSTTYAALFLKCLLYRFL